MPAKSKKQQMAAGAALSAKRGERPVSSLKGASREMVELDERKAARGIRAHEAQGFAEEEGQRLKTKTPAWAGVLSNQLSKNDRSFLLRLGCFNFRSALASICLMRSRVTENCWPTSSSV